MTNSNYFYIDKNGAQQGPRSLEQLKLTYVITPDTMMWQQGMTDWKKASEIEGLEELFVQLPPVASVPYTQNTIEQKPTVNILDKPRPWLIENILTTLFCCFIFGIIGIIYASKVDSLWVEGKYDQSRSASKTARLMFILSIVSVAVGGLLYVVIISLASFSAFTL